MWPIRTRSRAEEVRQAGPAGGTCAEFCSRPVLPAGQQRRGQETSEEGLCLHQARASDSPQKHHGAPGVGVSSPPLLRAALGQEALGEDIATDHQHRPQQREVGGEAVLHGSPCVVLAQVASLSTHLPSAGACLTHPERDK